MPESPVTLNLVFYSCRSGKPVSSLLQWDISTQTSGNRCVGGIKILYHHDTPVSTNSTSLVSNPFSSHRHRSAGTQELQPVRIPNAQVFLTLLKKKLNLKSNSECKHSPCFSFSWGIENLLTYLKLCWYTSDQCLWLHHFQKTAVSMTIKKPDVCIIFSSMGFKPSWKTCEAEVLLKKSTNM